ncbi:hypothetical protein OKW41_002856 [Paraburkholderia sp. UCT70]|uniref:hypothetical protein n=1 Tax=Paraburkholderia sp. UCT70 TaxID=2991068 RepID=UPI003D21B7AC
MGDDDRVTGVMQLDADRLAQSAHATRYYRDLLCHRIVLTNSGGVPVWSNTAFSQELDALKCRILLQNE